MKELVIKHLEAYSSKSFCHLFPVALIDEVKWSHVSPRCPAPRRGPQGPDPRPHQDLLPSLITTTTPTSMARLHPSVRLLGRRALHTTNPHSATPLYMLSALSHARETQHFSRTSGLGVTNHVPNLEAIQSSEVAPFADPTIPLQHPRTTAPGPAEARVRQQLAAFVMKGELSVLRPGRVPLPSQRTELAMAIVARAEDAALSAGARARIMVAKERDATAAEAAEAMPAVAVLEDTVAAPRVAQVVEEPVVEKREKKYQSFSAEQMQIGLLVALVALVAVNAYAFETLGAEREARERLTKRLGLIEAWLAQATATAPAAVAAPVSAVAVSKTAADAPVQQAVVERRSLGQKIAGWTRAAFWAS